MASAIAGFELPATSLMAPLLGRIAPSSPQTRDGRSRDGLAGLSLEIMLNQDGALITSGQAGWQYDVKRGQPGVARKSALYPQPCRHLLGEGNGVDVPSIIGLLAVERA